MQSPVTFDRPWLLLLLPLALAAFWWLGRRSYAGLNPGTAQLALVVALPAGDAAGLRHGGHPSGPAVGQAGDDLSAGCLQVRLAVTSRRQGREYINKAVGAKRAGDQGGVIEFGRTANVDEAPSETMQTFEQGKASVAGDATNLAEAAAAGVVVVSRRAGAQDRRAVATAMRMSARPRPR